MGKQKKDQPDNARPGSDRSASKILISYARGDGRILALELKQEIEKAGNSVWMDAFDMKIGENWWLQLEEKIKSARIVVLVVTDSALKSEVVRREWMCARRIGTRVMPVTDNAHIFKVAPRWMGKADYFVADPKNPNYAQARERFFKQLLASAEKRPAPLMAASLTPQYTKREREHHSLVDKFLDETRTNPKFSTVVLAGPPGFGKTTIAQAVCHDQEIEDAFTEGILWATLGEKGQGVLKGLNAMIRALSEHHRDFKTPDEGAVRLKELLAHRDCLLVLDDVWDQAHLNPFLVSDHCARLITTRDPNRFAISASFTEPLGAMLGEEAAQMLTGFIPKESVAEADAKMIRTRLLELAERVGEWPLLLNIFGGALRREIEGRKSSLANALRLIHQRIKQAGLSAFDTRNPKDRNQALAVSVKISLQPYQKAERRRLLELAIFPADQAIPEDAALRLWASSSKMKDGEPEKLLEDFGGTFFQFDHETGLSGRVLRFHDALREHLSDQLTEAQTLKLHRQFLKSYNPRGVAWTSIKGDGYLHDHLAYHLAGSGQSAELYRLIDHPWMKAQAERTGSHLAFLGDLDLALEHAEAEIPINLVQLLRGSLIAATVVSRSNETPPQIIGVLARARQDERASGLATLIADEEKRCDAFRCMAEAYFACSALVEADKAFAQSLSAARAIHSSFDWQRAQLRLAPIAVNLGVFDQLLAEIGNYDQAWCRDETLQRLVEALAGQGSYREATTTAQAIGGPRQKAKALADLAVTLAQNDRADEAVKLARQALYQAEKCENGYRITAEARSVYAVCLSSAGQVDEARRQLTATNRLIDDRSLRAEILGKIALAEANLGQPEQANQTIEAMLEVAGRIDSPGRVEFEQKLKTSIALGLARANMPDAALNLARTLWLGDWATTLVKVAQAFPPERRRRFIDEVIMKAKQRDTLRDRNLAIASLELARTGMVKFAEDAAESIDDARTKLESFCGVAEQLAQTGLKEDAARMIQKAEMTAKTGYLSIEEPIGLSRIARSLVVLGLNQEAHQTANRAVRTIEFNYGLENVATILAEAGFVDQAIAATEKFLADPGSSDVGRATALRAIAASLARYARFGEALHIARDIVDQGEKSLAFCEIAEAFKRAGEAARASEVAADALAAADEIGDEALSGVCTTLLKADLIQQALEIAGKIDDLEQRAKALREIASQISINLIFGIEEAQENAAVEAAVEQAASATRLLWDQSKKSIVLSRLAEVGSNLREQLADEALRVGREIKDLPIKATTLSKVAAAFKDWSDRGDNAAQEAIAAAQAVGYPGRLDPLNEVATILAEAGYLDQAMAAVENKEAKFYCKKARMAIVRGLADGRRFPEAWRIGGEIGFSIWGEPRLADEIRQKQIACLLQLGVFNERAVEVAFEINDQELKASALCGVIDCLLKQKKPERAQEIAFKALEAVQSIKSFWEDSSTLDEVAKAATNSGLSLEELLNAVQKIEVMQIRIEFLGGLAVATKRLGNQQAALTFFGKALMVAHSAGCAQFWKTLAKTSDCLALIDQGQTLWESYQELNRIEHWLKV
jgi:tetratricopeptide (TPR) repeat protein